MFAVAEFILYCLITGCIGIIIIIIIVIAVVLLYMRKKIIFVIVVICVAWFSSFRRNFFSHYCRVINIFFVSLNIKKKIQSERKIPKQVLINCFY